MLIYNEFLLSKKNNLHFLFTASRPYPYVPPEPTPSKTDKTENTSIVVDATIETHQPLITPEPTTSYRRNSDLNASRRNSNVNASRRNSNVNDPPRKISNTSGPNWLLASKEDLLLDETGATSMVDEPLSTESARRESIYSSTIDIMQEKPLDSTLSGEVHLLEASTIVQHAAYLNQGYDNETIYESLD